MSWAWPIGLLCAGVLSLAAGASPYWLDSGELASAGASAGVMHPPGAPGLVSLFYLASFLPIGTLALRVCWMSSLLGGFTIALALSWLHELRVSRAWQMVFVVGMLGSLTFSRHARVVEIYTYSTCLCMLTLYATWRWQQARENWHWPILAAMSCVIAGLGFADLRLFAAGYLPWLAWKAWRCDRLLFVALLLACVGASMASLCLVATALADPRANWGDPATFLRWWDHLQATSIRRAFASTMSDTTPTVLLDRLTRLGGRLLEDLGVIGLPLGLLAWLPAYREPRLRSVFGVLLWLALCEALYAWLVNPMGEVDRQTATPLEVLWIFLAAWFGSYLCEKAARVTRVAGLSVAVTSVALSSYATQHDFAATRSWYPHWFTTQIFEQQPPGGVLLTQSDDLAAQSLALQVMEGARPDLAVLPMQHLYRRPPPADCRHRIAAQVWQGTRGGGSEAQRLARFAAATKLHLALEAPASMMLATSSLAIEGGSLPLGMTARTSWNAWRPWLVENLRWTEAASDRQRVARTLTVAARLLLRAGDRAGLAAAEQIYVSMLHDVVHDDPAALLSLAVVLRHQGRCSEAIALLDRVLSSDVPSLAARIQRGYCALELTKPDLVTARTMLREVRKRAPQDSAGQALANELCEKFQVCQEK